VFDYTIKNKLKNNLLILFFKFIEHVRNIKYNYLTTYNRKIGYKKCNAKKQILYHIYFIKCNHINIFNIIL